jgi:ribosomal protein S9
MATTTKTKEDRYIEAVGRRKTAVARARITPSSKTAVVVNDKDINNYFVTEPLRVTALEPFLKVTLPTQFTVTVVVNGGGLAIDYAVTNYLPRISQGIIKIIMRNSFSTKGGIAKKRYFKKKIF